MNEPPTTLVNLCPHPVVLPELGIELPPCHDPPRLGETVVEAGAVWHDGKRVPIYFKAITRDGCKLPPWRLDTWYIVPLAIAQAFPERTDLLVPHDSVRDENGRVVGVRGLARIVDRATIQDVLASVRTYGS